jgi:hypothetical protein
VLRETTSRGQCELVCPSRTNERGGEGYCVKGGGEEERERERERAGRVHDIQTLFVKQNGECLKCGEFMKTCGYGKGDKKQFSIDRIDSKKGHTKDNIQLFCWCCNRSKKNRF